MDEFLQLLYITGILDEEEAIYNNDYILRGSRIQSLSKNHSRNVYIKSKNLTVRFGDLNIEPISYDEIIAQQQIRTAIEKNILSLCKKINKGSTNISKIKELLNSMSQELTNISFRIVDQTPKYEKAIEVSGTNTILVMRVFNVDYYIPVNPVKSFDDKKYYMNSDRNTFVHMIHIELVYTFLFIIHNLNSLLKEFSLDHLFTDISKGYASKECLQLLYHSWSPGNMPDWLQIFLTINENNSQRKVCGSSNDKNSTVRYPIFDKWLLTFEPIIKYAFYGEKISSSIFTPSLYKNIKLNRLISFGIHIIIHLIKVSNERIDNHKKQIKHGHTARVFETKRNIPNKILKEMRSSSLNSYFDFVEFDKDVDLEKVRTVVNEFVMINKRIFFDLKYPNKCVRIRKLGRHKASGLYFPALGTLTIDIRHPSSFYHEYFHMIDDILDDISGYYTFTDISDSYQKLLLEKINIDKEQGITHFSKTGKYNLNYYLKRCEIFARCGEIYLFRIRNIKSSLLKQDNSQRFAYPDDPELNRKIEKYYNNLLNKLHEMKEQIQEGRFENNICIADR